MVSNNNVSGSFIFVTGATGFIGQALCAALEQHGLRVRRALHSAQHPGASADSVVIGDIDPFTAWDAALRGVDTVIHLAARTHVMNESDADMLTAYRKINLDGTRRLAEAAARAGVRCFMLMSSVKVNGEATTGKPFTEADMPQPEDSYGLTKWEAEQALRQISERTGMETVVLRAPLVYGPGAKGNLLALMKALHRGMPLPLASVRNSRSLIYIDNLIDAILACMNSPVTAGKTYLVSDGEDVSTPDLIRALAAALGVPDRLFPFPVALLKLGAALVGKGGEIARLSGSLRVDSSRIRDELGWKPRFGLAEGLDRMAQHYLNSVIK